MRRGRVVGEGGWDVSVEWGKDSWGEEKEVEWEGEEGRYIHGY